MKYFLTLALISGTLAVYSQTTILLRKTKSSITLAADTRVRNTSVYKNGIFESKTEIVDTFRKIGGANNLYFGISGSYIKNMFEYAKHACANSKTIYEAAEKFYNNVSPILFDSLNRLNTVNKKRLENEYLNRMIVGIVFCAFQDTAEFVRIIITPIPAPDGIMLKPDIVVSAQYDAVCNFGFGHLTAIDKKIHDEKLWAENSAVNGMIKLIKIQSKATPLNVSPPIDILTLTKGKVVLKRYN